MKHEETKYVQCPITMKIGDKKVLTKGKKYAVINGNPLTGGFNIKNDLGQLLFCLPNKCAHLNDLNWIT